MFRCGISGEVSEPREKPVKMVLATRPARYTNQITNEELKEEIVISSGYEIAKEINARLRHVDANMASRIAAARRPINFQFFEALSETRFEHARKCKKALDDCPHCQDNVKFFGSLPLNVLSHMTEEKRFK